MKNLDVKRNFNIKYNLLCYEIRDLFLQKKFSYIYIHIYKDFAIILLNCNFLEFLQKYDFYFFLKSYFFEF